MIALFGPTGVGKTAVAIALAARLRALGEQPVAVSADALQVYAGLETLTGAASTTERAALAHRLISFLPVDATFSVGQYAELAHAEIEPTDRQRIVRSLELLDTGELEPPEGESELWTAVMRRPTLLVGLVMERERLYARIDARAQEMIAAGVLDEVRRAHAAGASITARKALGFEELLAGDVEAMKRHTRNYARRQLTWMRKLAAVCELDTTGRSASDVAGEVEALWLRTGA